MLVRLSQQQRLGSAAGIHSLSNESCRHDPSPVRNQKVIWSQKLIKLGEDAVRQPPRPAIHNHQPSCVPWLGGSLSDQLLGKLVVKIRGPRVGALKGKHSRTIQESQDQVEADCEKNANDQTRHEWEIKGASIPADRDVSGQTSEKRHSAPGRQE